MNQYVSQVCFGHNMEFFKKGLIARWGLKPYTDVSVPTLFFGSAGQLKTIQEHKGFGIIYPVDQTECRLNEIPPMKNIILLDRPLAGVHNNWNRYKGEFQIKDFSLYKPNPLGESVYVYLMPWHFSSSTSKLINEIKNKMKYNIITPAARVDQFMSEEHLKKNFYDNCFVNLNLTHANGLTTVIELALMGRKTISKVDVDYKCIIRYDDVDSILYLIEKEAEKIGSVQPEIDVHTLGDEWLSIDFWKTKFNLQI